VLLAARSQQAQGVANAHDVVGRYFMEHPHYYGAVGIVHLPEMDRRFYTRMASDLKRANGTPVRVMGAFGLTAEVARRERLLNFSAAFHPTKEDAETGVLRSENVQALLTRGRGAYQAAQLTIRTEQSPLAESRVSLSDEADPLGMPRAALDWRIAPEDDVQLHRALVLLGRELGASGIARAWIPGDSSRFVWRPSPGGHHLGTTRMGTDPRTSVVDANCRTHQLENLYIAGSSVFPTGGEANPTLTIVALAHRLADTLKRTA
jgi:choline dehydrogenase-like flavoprotein